MIQKICINKGCCAVVYEFCLFVFSAAHTPPTLRNAVCQTLIGVLS